MEKTITEFINDEVLEYSLHTIKRRAIPSIIDGLKPVQRKILFTADKKAKDWVKTSSFIGSVSSDGGYDKGDASVEETTVKMVKDFPGSNNYTFLLGSGNFGGRFLPDSYAATRYTKVKISPNFKKFFIDNEMLTYTIYDGEKFEPNFYLPIIPTVLINGIEGIATGFSCEFQPYKVEDIVENIKRYLNGKPMKEMVPFFNGFKGTVIKEDGKWVQVGIIEEVNSSTLKISEIPTGISREKYIALLDKLSDDDKIKSYVDQCNKSGFGFTISVTREQMISFRENPEKMYKMFRLKTTLNDNMNAINENDVLIHFENVLEIIKYFVDFRLSLLTEKKKICKENLKQEEDLLLNKMRFINMVMSNEIQLKGQKKNDLEKYLTDKKFRFIDKIMAINIYNFTKEEIDKLKEKLENVKKEWKYYDEIKEKDLYIKDLGGFI